jgi:hypothetical protein
VYSLSQSFSVQGNISRSGSWRLRWRLKADDGTLSDSEISSGEELILNEYKLVPTDEDDEDYRDYDGEESEEGEDDTDANLQDFAKQHKHYEYYTEIQLLKAAYKTAKLELGQNLRRLTYSTCLKNPLDRNNRSLVNPAFNTSS